MLGLGVSVRVRIGVLWVRAVSCVFPEHSRPIQPVASLTAIQVALNTMFVEHDGYRADGAEVQISFLYQFFTFTLTGYRITEECWNTINICIV